MDHNGVFFTFLAGMFCGVTLALIGLAFIIVAAWKDMWLNK